MKPELKFFAALWTLREYPTPESEWTLPEKFGAVKDAGFEAIGGRLLPEIPKLCERFGLEFVAYLDVDETNYRAQLRQAVAWKPRRINVQLCDHDTAPEAAVIVWVAAAQLAQELGLAIDLELHRDTATETPEKAFAIADSFEKATGQPIRFCLDFSHFAVTKHLLAPFAQRLLTRPEIIRRTRQMHLRPFNGHHAQVPATNGQGSLTVEFRDYLQFVDLLFGEWLKTANTGDTLYACPENGPRLGGYGLSAFPDVWQDAIIVRNEVRGIWDRHMEAPSPNTGKVGNIYHE